MFSSIIAIAVSMMDPVVPKVTPVNFGRLKDTGLSEISFGYLGFKGTIPDSTNIDWNRNIVSLWNQKLRINNVSKATQGAAGGIINRYRYQGRETMTINEHMTALDADLTKIKAELNWSQICIDYDLDPNKCRLFVYTAYNLDAKMLTAYSLTELMPYTDGKKNVVMMDLYMETAGRNYLDSIPALGDTYLSMGRYQFTSYAVGADDDGLRPTNKIASYSLTYDIPGSVVKLEGIQNDYAAYYFSVYNLMSLIKKLNNKQVVKYAYTCANRKDELVQYIATAHHNPKWARKRAIEWISDSCQKPLISYQGERLEIYSIKTRSNYENL